MDRRADWVYAPWPGAKLWFDEIGVSKRSVVIERRECELKVGFMDSQRKAEVHAFDHGSRGQRQDSRNCRVSTKDRLVGKHHRRDLLLVSQAAESQDCHPKECYSVAAVALAASQVCPCPCPDMRAGCRASED